MKTHTRELKLWVCIKSGKKDNAEGQESPRKDKYASG